MPAVTVHPVRYGRHALEVLAAVVATAKADDPLAPLTIVVPTNSAGITARRALAAAGGVAGLTVLTVYRLAELLGGPLLAARGRRPVTGPVLGAAMAQALARQPGVFTPVAGHPATVPALVEAHRLLSALAATADEGAAALDELARAGARAAEVVRLHRAVRSELSRHWHDEADLLVAAGEAVRAHSPLVAALGTVVVHLPQETVPGARALLATIAEQVPVHVVAGLTGDDRADAAVVATVRAIGGTAPQAPSTTAPQAPGGPPGAGDGPTTTIVTVSDPDEEVRAAVREVVAAALAGTPLERIAVLVAVEEPYVRILHDHLAGAGVRAHVITGPRPHERVVGRGLLGLLDLHATGFRRRDVLAVLAGTPVLDGHGRALPETVWQRLTREAGVVAGREQWADRLARLATRLRAEADLAEGDPDRGGDIAEGLRRRADRVERCRAQALELFDAVTPPARASWAQRSRWAEWLLATRLGDEARWTAEGWPPAEITAGRAVVRALDRLAGLDALDPAGPDHAAFRRALEEELASGPGRVGRFGDGVLIGPLSAAVGLSCDLVIVVGLAEGTAPPAPVDDPLLPDHERRRVPDLPLAADRPHRAHRWFLAALGAAPRRVLIRPRGDLRVATDRVASRWLAPLDGTGSASGHREIPSFAGGLRLGPPATAQELRLGRLLRDPGEVAVQRAADPVFARGVGVLTARASDRFTPFDGNLSELAGVLPRPGAADTAPVSPTRLEEWVRCPYASFVRRVLGVEPVEEPDDLLRLSALDRGSLIHECLDRFVRGHLDHPAGAPWGDAHRQALLAVFEHLAEGAAAAGITGHDVLWARDRARLRRDLLAWLDQDSARRQQEGVRTLATEHAFGPGSPADPVPWPLPDGTTLWFRGRIDRIDIDAGGGVRVVDYKTGKPGPYRVLEQDPTDAGRRLQLPVYARAAARLATGAGADPTVPVRARYEFVGTDWVVELVMTDSVEAQVSAAFAVAAAGIGGGLFPAHPEPSTRPTYVPCRACDPDGLGVGDLVRAWERKRGAPELAAYLALIGEQGTNGEQEPS